MNWNFGLRIALVRHPESYKTQANRHGGLGEPLTERGRADIINLANFLLRSLNITQTKSLIFASTAVHVLETGNMLQQLTGIKLVVDQRLKNIHMGVFDGLSNDEIWEKYPEPARQLQMWRDGQLDVSEVDIPDAESMNDFIMRIKTALDDILTNRDNEIVVTVVTRSVGVAITNILLANTDLKGKPYTRFRFNPASVSLFQVNGSDSAIVHYHNNTDFLNREVEYPDD
jgi:broad specificity phosphatase PhoE